jgi:Holliday junction DNA helicase RuvA
MYAKLTGKIVDILSEYVIVDVNGVGYRVEGIDAAIENEQVSLYIYTHVREQEIRLFGFRTKDALAVFEMLLDVQGVGPKSAVKLVSLLGVETIVHAIINDDSLALKVPGLGDKLSKKIIIDLKNKITKLSVEVGESKTILTGLEDVIAAIESLGYAHDKVVSVLRGVEVKDMSQQEIIKLVLKMLNNA